MASPQYRSGARTKRPTPARRPLSDQPSRAQGPLAGSVAIVAGAGRGIGRATAELFAKEGARVVLCSRTRHELDSALAAIHSAGGEAIGRIADIGLPRQARLIVGFAVRRFGQVDYLINNAGVLGPRVPLIEYPLHEWDEVLRINLTGTFYVTREAAIVMVRQRSGCIISVSSSVGRHGRAGWGAYAVSKFGVEGMSQVLADELRESGVRVITFNPGGTRTAMRASAYPEEDPSLQQAPSVPAAAILRLALRTTLGDSGRAFDSQNVP